MKAIRSGIGIDIHRLEDGVKLVIGGVSVPSPKGSVGHSDGDVLLHAIVDALLGAASLGDIGRYFPSDDAKWKGAKSKIFLKQTSVLLSENQKKIIQIDSTVLLQNPKLSPYIDEMRKNISAILNIPLSSVSVKAKTTDYLGVIGDGGGIAAISIATIAE